MPRIFARTALLFTLLLPLPLAAQAPQTEGEAVEAVEAALNKKKVHFFNGVAVGADFVGLIMKVAGSDWAQPEVLARVNLLDKYFPVFELGLGEADHEGREIENHFKTRAPYFRVGADYNINKKHNGNRLFAGLRYGFSSYSYDFYSPVPLTDPVWKQSQELNLTDLKGSTHWGEIVIGMETKLWTIIRLGWDMRFKFILKQNPAPEGEPWYIPGYGKSAPSIGWGGTFKLLFDI